MKYEIQQFTVCDGWANTWTVEYEDGKVEPHIFDTYADADCELKEFLQDSDEAFFNGWIESRYHWHEFRIREVKP